MQISKIGNFRIIKGKDFKQIYSQHKMLQINPTQAFYIDLDLMKVIKRFKRVLKEVNNGNKNY